MAAPLVISAAGAGPAAVGFSLFPLPAAFSPPLAAPDFASDSVYPCSASSPVFDGRTESTLLQEGGQGPRARILPQPLISSSLFL